MTDEQTLTELQALQAERVRSQAAEQARTRRQRELIAQLGPYVRAADLARALGVSHTRATELLRSANPSAG